MNNQIKIKIEGLNLTRLINKLVSDGVLVNNLIIKKHYIVFFIDSKHEEILRDVCKKEHKSYKILYKSGILNFFSSFKYYFGTFLAIVISICWLFSINSQIFYINVKTATLDDFDLSQINVLLKDAGVIPGANRYAFSTSQIQKLILETQDNVAGCTVKKNGGNIDICIYPSTNKNLIYNHDIESKYDAIITEIQIYNGESNLKVGDIVKKGEVLIKSTDGASGIVRGKVVFSDYILYNEDQINIVKTGNNIRVRRTKLFNKYFTKYEYLPKYSHYIAENCVFYVAYNLFLPVICEETIFYEVEFIETKIPFSQVEDKLKDKLYRETLKLVSEDDCITNTTYSIVTEGNYTRIDCFIECEINLF